MTQIDQNRARPLPPTLGVILAGGRAARMGGGDKPLQMIGGQTILDRVITCLSPQCAGLILSANGDPMRFAPRTLPVVADSVADYPGPLGGILSALEWCADHHPDIDWVLSAPGDCPFLPPDLVSCLHAARQASDALLAIAASGGHRHPTVALWHVSLRDALRHALVVADDRRANGFVKRHDAAVATWPDTPVDPFFNVNTPELLEQAEWLAPIASRDGAPPA